MSDVKRDWKCAEDCEFCFQDRALQAMHDLLVWAVCQVMEDAFDAAYQNGYDDAVQAWSRGVR